MSKFTSSNGDGFWTAREQVMHLPTREQFALTIERAEAPPGQSTRRIVRGYANTFNVMRSGRMIHPDGLTIPENAKIPLLAQHGAVAEFATIGVIQKTRIDRTKGLYFEAQIANGTELADQAYNLISQGMLGAISVGWSSRQARYVRANDADIDPFVKKKLADAELDEALVFMRSELMEISLVDVPDDPGARLAASAGGLSAGVVRELLAAHGVRMTERDAEQFHRDLKRRLGQDKPLSGAGSTETAVIEAASAAAVAACRAYHQENAEAIQTLIVETIESAMADRDGDYAARLLDEDLDGVEVSCGHNHESPSETGGLKRALARVRSWKPGGVKEQVPPRPPGIIT